MSSLDFILGLASGLGAAVGLAIVVWFLFLREPADRSPSDPPAGMFPEEPMAASVERTMTPLPRFPSEPTAPPLGPPPSPPEPIQAPPEPSEAIPPSGVAGSPPLAQPLPVLEIPTVRREPDPERLRTSYRILLHIARQGRVGPEEIPPKSISQAGMVEALGVTQGALTGCLSRLVAAGILRVQRSHVRGHDRRVKVYELTSKGEELVRELRRRTPPRPSNPIDPSRSGAFPSHRD